MKSATRRRAVSLLLGAAVLGGCKDNGTQEPPPTPTIAVAAANASVDVLPGGTATVNVNVTRGGGYTGAVTVTAEGLPAGVTIAPATVAPGATSAALAVSATAAAAIGTSTVTLVASGAGVNPASAAFTLNVLQPPAIQIALAPTAVTVQQGGSGTLVVNLTRLGGFSGAVTLAAENVPAGVTIPGATIAAGATSAVLTVDAAAAAALTTSNVTVRATGTGVAVQTANFAVTVTPPPSMAIALNPSALTVAIGATGTVAVAVTRGGGFAGAVTLAAENLPAGVLIGNVTVAPGETTGQLTVNVLTAQPGTYTIPIRATAAGLAAQTANLTLTVPTPPGIQIGLEPAAVSVPVTGNATFTVNLTRTGGFTGPVTLTAEGAPSGVTIPNVTIAAGASSAQMTVSASANAIPAATNMTIRATGAGVPPATAALALTVTPPPGFTMALNPAAVTVIAGQSTQTSLAITRVSGFADPVTLTTTSAPSGITVTYNPATVTQNTAQVTVAAAPTVAPGLYQVTVTGAAAGLANRSATLTVTVTGGITGGNVAFQFCEADGLPIWVAAQDGNGPWTRVLGDAQNRYAFQVSSPRGGVAWVTADDDGGFDLTVYYYSQAELIAQGGRVCSSAPGATRTVNVNFLGLAPEDNGLVTVGSGSGSAFGSMPVAVVSGIGPGNVDVVASRVASFGTVSRLYLARTLNPASGSTLDVDFDGPNSYAPATGNITVNNLGADFAATTVTYITAGGAFAPLSFTGSFGGANQQYRTFPNAVRLPQDLQLLTVRVQPVGTQIPDNFRFAYRVIGATADVSVDLGPVLTPPTITTVATQPYARLRASYPVQAEYNSLFQVTFDQENPSRSAIILMSGAYLGGGGTAVLEVPDFTGVAGWNNTWGLARNVPTAWSFMATRFTTGDPTTPLSAGMTYQAALRTGTITP
jgi:hypothetical protein